MHVVARDPDELDGLVGYVHDWWLDLDELRHDPESRTFEADLTWGRRPSPELLLRIHNVLGVEIRDTERVGCYDINTIEVVEDRALVIEGCIPLTITVVIEELHAEVLSR